MNTKLTLCFALSMVTLSASARPNPPQPPRAPRVVTLRAEGVGGSTEGNRRAACDRAVSRAPLGQIMRQCTQSMRGNILQSGYEACHCSGPSRDLKCRVNAYVDCAIR
jgi:hypothetical protein